MLLADRGYDADAIRQMVAAQGAWANIPPKANRKQPICFSQHLYKARNLVERFFNKIKHFRRIATRYDKLAENYLAALKPALSSSFDYGYAFMSLRPKNTIFNCVIFKKFFIIK
jgi:transposase